MIRRSAWLTLGVALILPLAGCSSDGAGRPSTASPTAARAAGGEHRPYPYTTPTPPAEISALDGVYRRDVPPAVVGGAGKCRRCPPYRLSPGPERLSFERGVFRIHPEGDAGFRTVGHFEVAGSRLEVFNDPNCPRERGVYRWALAGGELTLRAVDDGCAFGDVRARYLEALGWEEVS